MHYIHTKYNREENNSLSQKCFPETAIMEHQEAGHTDGNVNPIQLNSIRKKAMTY
jgi:hypothetical protein